jgi:hypothetical protein
VATRAPSGDARVSSICGGGGEVGGAGGEARTVGREAKIHSPFEGGNLFPRSGVPDPHGLAAPGLGGEAGAVGREPGEAHPAEVLLGVCEYGRSGVPRHGRRFATDSQTLTLNWPSKRTRAPVAVHHLCTAHANSGYIVAAHLQLDPAVDLPAIEGQMSSVGDFALPRAFRSQARVWSQSEFSDYIDKITREVVISTWEAPEVEEGLQLPHCGALIRQDIMQLSHAFFLRKMLGKGEERFVFVLDADSGLALAFASAFAARIRRGLADILVVAFDKHKSNDERNSLVADGKALFESDTGFSRGHLDSLPADQAIELLDTVIQLRMWHEPVGAPFLWPYHTKSEPLRTIRLLADRPEMERARRARLMRLATLRSVDSYFHKVRSNLRFASRPAHTPSGNGRAWDRHYLYKPQTMVKLVEIYRFSHNWMGARQTKETPAMKLGLARGKIYERDLFAG